MLIAQERILSTWTTYQWLCAAWQFDGKYGNGGPRHSEPWEIPMKHGDDWWFSSLQTLELSEGKMIFQKTQIRHDQTSLGLGTWKFRGNTQCHWFIIIFLLKSQFGRLIYTPFSDTSFVHLILFVFDPHISVFTWDSPWVFMIFSVSFCICRSYATAGDLKDVPIYDGTLERFDKDKNSGVLSAAVYGISWVRVHGEAQATSFQW